MRAMTAGAILAAEAILGWSVGLHGAAFLTFVALWGLVLLLYGPRGTRRPRVTGTRRPRIPVAERAERDSADSERARSELV